MTTRQDALGGTADVVGSSTIERHRGVPIPMPDGAILLADVHLARGAAPSPTILIRTPYGRATSIWPAFIDLDLAIDRGYAVVVQDVRGRGGSDGRFEPFVAEADDGAATIAWIAAQPWSDGAVVMTGMSYQGFTQWAAATRRPPALRAIAPVMSSRTWGEGALFTAGVRETGLIGTWIAANLAEPDRQWLTDLERSFHDVEGLIGIADYAKGWFAEPAASDYWAPRSALGEIGVPAFVIGGWYDLLLRGTLADRGDGGSRDRLLIGPWGHVIAPTPLIARRDLGHEGTVAAIGLHARILDFFDAAIRGREPATPPVEVFALGARRWTASEAWPPPSVDTVLDLEIDGDGAIAVDPERLPRFLGGRSLLIESPDFGMGPADQVLVAARDDVVRLDAGPLPAPLRIAGRVRLELATAATGDGQRQWAAMCCIATADGALDALLDGVVTAPADAPGVVLDLGDIAIELAAGDRLVVLVAGGWYPRWEPPATGAIQRIRSARLHLPVVEGWSDHAG